MALYTCTKCNQSFNSRNNNPQFCSRACRYFKTPEERFWEKIIKSFNPEECWQWKGGTAGGYGKFSLNSRKIIAHRYSYMLHNNCSIPDDVRVCHSCDNPVCCNPNHLWLGTDSDNVKDRQDKGRTARGEYSGCSKLNKDTVRQVRFMYRAGHKQVDIARHIGITQAHVSSIVTNKSWSHI